MTDSRPVERHGAARADDTPQGDPRPPVGHAGGILDLRDLQVSEIMVHRTGMKTIDIDAEYVLNRLEEIVRNAELGRFGFHSLKSDKR